jgi:hypothetical protein
MASDPSASTSAAAGPPRGALLVIFLTVFIDLLGFGIVLPVMPRQAEPYLAALQLSPLSGGIVIGLLFSVFSLMQFLFSPVWGRLSDQVGRRPMLILSLVGSVVFYALYGYAVTLPPERAAAGPARDGARPPLRSRTRSTMLLAARAAGSRRWRRWWRRRTRGWRRGSSRRSRRMMRSSRRFVNGCRSSIWPTLRRCPKSNRRRRSSQRITA